MLVCAGCASSVGSVAVGCVGSVGCASSVGSVAVCCVGSVGIVGCAGSVCMRWFCWQCW